MAKKATVWISKTQVTPQGRKTLNEFKEAAAAALRSYAKLRVAQQDFDRKMQKLDEAAYRATIPHLCLK